MGLTVVVGTSLVRFPDPTYGVGRENEPLMSWEQNWRHTTQQCSMEIPKSWCFLENCTCWQASDIGATLSATNEGKYLILAFIGCPARSSFRSPRVCNFTAAITYISQIFYDICTFVSSSWGVRSPDPHHRLGRGTWLGGDHPRSSLCTSGVFMRSPLR